MPRELSGFGKWRAGELGTKVLLNIRPQRSVTCLPSGVVCCEDIPRLCF